MSEQLPPSELAGLNKRIDELFAAVADLKAANTPKEKKEAREDVEEAGSSLKRYAEAHGISLQEAEEAMEHAQRQSRKRLAKEAIMEFTEEDWADIFPARDETEEKPAAEEKEKKPKQEKKEPPKEEDNPPTGEHWTDRPLFSRS